MEVEAVRLDKELAGEFIDLEGLATKGVLMYSNISQRLLGWARW